MRLRVKFMPLKSKILIVLFLISCSQANADGIDIVGTTQHTLTRTQTDNTTHPKPDTTSITLMDVELSDKVQQMIHQDIEESLEHENSNITALAQKVTAQAKYLQLGMNNVPVLDQGRHGTCVTFAITAAMNAALNKGNYISQLCLLQLGLHLENIGHEKSGWDGLNGEVALNRIAQYGIINLKQQQQYGCGQVKQYPYWSTPLTEMSIDEYVQLSEKPSKNQVTWSKLFNKSRITSNKANQIKTTQLIKQALSAGNRVAFSVLLPRSDLGTMGAVAWHHYLSDTWVLTHEIAQELNYQKRFPSHEMIITGYDDNAVAMDRSGHRHHGLFTVRNSWGAYVADWGTFYMSYDYVDALAMDGHQIGAAKAPIVK